MAFGDAGNVIADGRNVTTQGISGTGSLRIGSAFLAAFSGGKTIYLPRPSWGNHNPIFTHAGNKIDGYSYYDPKTCGFNADGCFNDLKNNVPDGSVVLFHACAHNPTGVDPTAEQWKQLSEICKEKSFTVYFDMAYQVRLVITFIKHFVSEFRAHILYEYLRVLLPAQLTKTHLLFAILSMMAIMSFYLNPSPKIWVFMVKFWL